MCPFASSAKGSLMWTYMLKDACIIPEVLVYFNRTNRNHAIVSQHLRWMTLSFWQVHSSNFSFWGYFIWKLRVIIAEYERRNVAVLVLIIGKENLIMDCWALHCSFEYVCDKLVLCWWSATRPNLVLEQKKHLKYSNLSETGAKLCVHSTFFICWVYWQKTALYFFITFLSTLGQEEYSTCTKYAHSEVWALPKKFALLNKSSNMSLECYWYQVVLVVLPNMIRTDISDFV